MGSDQRASIDSQSGAPRRTLQSALVAERMAKLGRGPYDATHGTPLVGLNLKVSVRPGVDDATGLATGPDQKVACRHLALEFTEASKKALLMKEFSSPDGMAKYFDGALAAVEAEYRRSMAQADPSSKQVVSSAGLGRYLAAVATALDTPQNRGASAEANCLLLTARHAMAIHVESKSKDGVDYFAVKLYDPNNTASYKRVEVKRPEDLEHLQLADMLAGGQTWVDAYGAPGNAGAPVSMAAVCLTDGVKPATDRSRTEATARNMCVALAAGARDDIRAMVQSAASGSPDELFHLLQAKEERLGVPGNLLALQNGHTETVKEFAGAVLNSPLAPHRQIDLMAAKDAHGVPGLALAIQRGHTETVRAFVDAVAGSTLPSEQKVALLASKNSTGTPLMSRALQSGRPETVGQFAAAILGSALAPGQKVDLLACKDSDGVPGLGGAFLCDDPKTVTAFVEAVAGSTQLDTAGKVEVLFAEMPEKYGGGSAVSGTIRHNIAPQATNAFREAVLASPLPDDAKTTLLSG
jgi:hypothetical protein